MASDLRLVTYVSVYLVLVLQPKPTNGRRMLSLWDYANSDAIGIVQMVQRGRATPAEIRELAVEALEAIAPWNVVEEIYKNREPNSLRGVLTGVPILHKDSSLQIEGLPRQYGSPLGVGHVGTHTNRVFQHLLHAGCDIVGRSRVPELVLSVVGDNARRGSPMNPFNPKYSMGGTTAGVAAVALGAVPIAQGADAGGSLRIPASWAGCYTLKPSARCVSAEPVGDQLFDLDQVFVATRSLRDLRAFRAVLGQGAPGDFTADLAPSHAPLPGRGIRLGVVKSLFAGLRVDSEHLDAIDEFTESAQRIGCTTSEVDLQLDFDEYCEALYTIFSVDLRAMVHCLVGADIRRFEVESQRFLVDWYNEAETIDGESLLSAVDYAKQASQTVSRLFGSLDFLVSPVTAQPAPRLDSLLSTPPNPPVGRSLNRTFEELAHFCAIFNLSGHPALVMPYTSSPTTGLPCGIQLAGPAGSDYALIDFAQLFDRGFRGPAAGLLNELTPG